MNKQLELLHPYPFQRFNQLLENVETVSNAPLIAWSMGEPRHEAARFLVEAMQDEALIRKGLGTYPPTKGIPELREAIAAFLQQRYNLSDKPDAETQVLPVTGTREALFAIAQAVISASDGGRVVMPNPFYQIYEGAAILAGAEPFYMNCTADNGFLPDFDSVPEDVWQDCELLYLCTPGNPTGAVMSEESLQQAIRLADRYNFVIVSDECYSEIYFDEDNPPAGLLGAADAMGWSDYRHCVAVNSLSKRSNLPGLRSGYVAGDAEILEKFLLYRTYHGSAMPVHHQLVSEKAWQDEQHVIDNRKLYREKFDAVARILAPVWPMQMPDAGFYFWPETPMADTDFAVRLIELANVKVLPGSFLSRTTENGNPGEQRVRMALVATLEECIEAAERIVQVWERM